MVFKEKNQSQSYLNHLVVVRWWCGVDSGVMLIVVVVVVVVVVTAAVWW
jgi:hypothetical protein